MSKGPEETSTAKNGPVIQGQVHAVDDHSPCVSDSSDGDEELDEESAVMLFFHLSDIFFKFLTHFCLRMIN